MKKVLSRTVLCALLTLAVIFTACKSPSSGGGGNPGGGQSGPSYIIDPNNPPLTLQAIAGGEITFRNLDKITGLKYKINDSDPIEITENSGSKSIQISANDVVSIFAQGTSNTSDYSTTFRINCSSDCYVYGNVMSLLTDDYQTATTISQNYAFAYLFYDNAPIKNHPEKEIVLPATTLAESCYSSMFEGCTSLTQAPDLPATTLAKDCYSYMFYCCTSLTQAPVLLATTLTECCYDSMFYGCTSLNKVTCLATDLSAAECTTSWLYGVASSGTFTKASGINWSRGIDGIPSGWTIVDYDKVSTPLTLEAITAGQITFNNFNKISNLKYRINDGEVTAATNTGISLSTGDKISLFAEGTLNGDSANQCFRIICSSDCYVYGNVMSLLTADYQTATEITQDHAFACLFYNNSHIKNHPSKNIVLPATTLAYGCYSSMFSGCTSLTQAPALPATTLAPYCYDYMFYGCTSLTQAPDLPATTLADYCYRSMFDGCTSLTQAPALPATALAVGCYYRMFRNCTSLTQAPALPATTLAPNCYHYMFEGCSSLTQAPALPATTLAYRCYSGMFEGCTSLTQAPDLPATTLADSCYSGMFEGCTSLTQAPALPATTLAEGCYYGMFYGCTSLNKVTCLATDLSAPSCTTEWLSGVASSGTFTKASGINWSRGIDGIPSGWTIKNK